MDCKNLNLLKSVIELNEADFDILCHIVKRDLKCTDLSEKVKKDNSTISRSLNKLCSFGIVKKQAKCCESKKGRYFLYSFAGDKSAKQAIKNALRKEYNSKKEKLELVFG